VIWIVLDALRQDIFSDYIQRGGLSSLMDEGVYFKRAFAQGSWTYPSFFSFLTGRYPFNCGVSRISHSDGYRVSTCADFDDTCPTIFSILREQGYQISSILDGWGFTVRQTAGQGHREDRYFEENWGWELGQGRRFMSLFELSDFSNSFINKSAQNGPFMIFIRSLYTHSPYKGIFKSTDYVTKLSKKRWKFRLSEGFVRGLAHFEMVYMNSLIETLKNQGALDNTIIVLTSDHGDMFWNLEDDVRKTVVEEEMWRHQLEPYNALVKVPLFIYGTSLRGVYPDRFRLMDLVPTLFDEMGIEYKPEMFDGVSIHTKDARPLYADSAGNGYGGVSLQDVNRKLIMSHRLGGTIYLITEDQYEHLSLRSVLENDLEKFDNFIKKTIRPPYENDVLDNDESLHRRLKALGYID
jgi:phosphoglycerol transferase MdoB-like AlkP superfamily enzyme